jgi:hypothetical protein
MRCSESLPTQISSFKRKVRVKLRQWRLGEWLWNPSCIALHISEKSPLEWRSDIDDSRNRRFMIDKRLQRWSTPSSADRVA